MEKNELFNDGTDKLIDIMKDLHTVNRKIAEAFTQFYGGTKEIEDDFDYMEAQRSIHDAISQVGKIFGSKVAEQFF